MSPFGVSHTGSAGSVHMPCTALGGLDGELHVLTQALTRNACVHAQLVDDLQTLGAGVLKRAELDVLDVELALQNLVYAATAAGSRPPR